MKNVIISCLTLEKEINMVIKNENTDMPVHYLPYELHSSPEKLHSHLQSLIDSITDADKIMLCVSRCGNSTDRLRATTAELVIPKTDDCLDILLSDKSVDSIERDSHGIFITESWMGSFRNSSLDLDTMTQKFGKAAAEEKLKNIYNGYTDFYIIDTGAYDTELVKEYISPLVQLLDGTLHIVKGRCGILHKMVTDQIDNDFYVIPKGHCFER